MVPTLPTLIPAGGGILVGGHDVVVTDPVAVRALIEVTGQFSAVIPGQCPHARALPFCVLRLVLCCAGTIRGLVSGKAR
jgi:hypothetical protein